MGGLEIPRGIEFGRDAIAIVFVRYVMKEGCKSINNMKVSLAKITAKPILGLSNFGQTDLKMARASKLCVNFSTRNFDVPKMINV